MIIILYYILRSVCIVLIRVSHYVKDRKELTRSRRLCGVFFQLTMCGVLHNVHEMYRSEGKTMVLLALASTVFHCWEEGIELSMAELSVSASI